MHRTKFERAHAGPVFWESKGNLRASGEIPARALYFFVINNFYFLFFHTQHNRISKIKQNKTADTYSTSQGSIKREGEREGQQEHKSHSFK